MAYEKTNWQDTFKDPQGNVTQEGTKITASRLNKMEDGIAGSASKQELTVTNQQLAETIRLDDTGVLDLNIFDEPTRAAIQGIEPGTINAVLGDGNVKPENTSFFTQSPATANLFNKETITMDKVLNEATGSYANLVGYFATDFIKVSASKTYYTTRSWSCVWFDENKTYVSGVTGAGTNKTLTPPKDGYLRVSFKYTDINTSMVAADALPSPYVAYSEKLSFKTTKQKEDISLDVLNVLKPQLESKWIGKTIETLGDSITWQDGKNYTSGTESGQVAIGYQTLIREQLLANVNNRGNSGARMANTTVGGADPAISVNAVAKTISYANVDLVTIKAGTNDQKYDIPLGTFGDIRTSVFDIETYIGAYRDTIEYILTQKPTVKIILMTPIQSGLSGWGFSPNAHGLLLKDYAAAVKEIGNLYGLPVIDLFGQSGITKNTMNTYTRDSVHPNNAGYRRMGDIILPFLNNH